MAKLAILRHPEPDGPFGELFDETPPEGGPPMDDDRMEVDEYLLDLIERTDWDKCTITEPVRHYHMREWGEVEVVRDTPF